MALIAMACSTVVPAAQAKGGFFVGGQAGEATYDDSGLDEDSAGTQAFSGGYRWQAGAITQVGFEAGFGKVDEITQDYSFDGGSYTQNDRIGMDADYRLIGANARFNFGRDSRWFAIGRGGYMDYEQNSSFQSATYVDGVQVFGYNDSVSDNGGGAYFGAGVGMDVTPNFNVNLMFNSYAYTSYDDGYTDEVSSATATTLGIEVRF
ncbi:MAG TPA: outer membrane beta-barrel protein [Lysobacter sp.]|nr:outer membrane beta-barrel protein [Lysobacter sp.]